jgi:signal transduction histidine kinase
MKSLMLASLFSVTLLSAFSQHTAITDSLKEKLALSQPDTNRVKILVSLSQYYHRANTDTSMQYAKEGLLLAERLQFDRGKADCFFWIGILLELEGLYPQALDRFQKSLTLSESINDKILISKAFRAIGDLYFDQGDYKKAMENITYAKAIQETIPGFAGFSIYRSLGRIHLALNQLDAALFYFNESYRGVMDRQDYLSSKVALDDVFKDLGQVHAKIGNDAQAMVFFRNSIPYSLTDKDYITLNETCIGIALLFKKSGQTDSSISYVKKGLEVAQQRNYLKGVLEATKLLSQLYEGINEHEALRYYKKAAVINDSLFNAEKIKQLQNFEFVEQQRKQKEAETERNYKNKIQLYALLGILGMFLLLALILYKNNRNKQSANKLLHLQKEEIQATLTALKATQSQLIQQEKMASLGELTAGIAHEIQNPLNFVNNFSEVNTELVDEIEDALQKDNKKEALAIAGDLKENLQKITHHGKRADAIVKGMLQHSRASTGKKEPTDINALADEYLRLSYHGLKAKDKSFNADFKTDFDESIGKIEVVPQDIGRVLLNLYNNAFYSINEKKKAPALKGENYEPTMWVTTKVISSPLYSGAGRLELSVKDNGNGIPQKLLDKIFQPFFTTKPTGEGTGLGLSLSYDIITKGHGGELRVNSKEGEYAEFVINLPMDSF